MASPTRLIGAPLTNPTTSPLREAPFPSAANFPSGAQSAQPAPPSYATAAACAPFPLAPPAHALAAAAETLPRMAIGAAAPLGWAGAACAGADALRLGCKRKGGAWMGGDGGAGGTAVGIPGVGAAGRGSARGMDGVVIGMGIDSMADMAELGIPAKRARLQPPEPLIPPSAPADPAYAVSALPTASNPFAPPSISPTSASPSSPVLRALTPPPSPPLSPTSMQASAFLSTPLTAAAPTAAPPTLSAAPVASVAAAIPSSYSAVAPIAASAPTSPPPFQGACSMDTISGSPHPPLHAQLCAPIPPTAPPFPQQETGNEKAIVLYSPPVIPSLSTEPSATGAGAAGAGRRAEREAMAGASASLAARAAMQQWPIEKLKAAWGGASPVEKRVLGGMIGSLLQGQPIQILGGNKLLEALQLHPPSVVGGGLEDAEELKAQAEGGEEDIEEEVEQAEQQPDSLMATADAMNLEQQKMVSSSSSYEGNNGEDVEMVE
ncbi:unnamed protein product [Closterium sp. Naga37s-1]|nr:unnamed protein product [Closterium sp. Naga37s-1]